MGTAVLIRMMLTGLVRMVAGMQLVAAGNMRMMIGGLLVMLCAFVCHKESPLNLEYNLYLMRVGHKFYTPVKVG